MSKRKIMHVLYLHLAWPNYGLDFEYYNAYRSSNTLNECLSVVLEQNLWLT